MVGPWIVSPWIGEKSDHEIYSSSGNIIARVRGNHRVRLFEKPMPSLELQHENGSLILRTEGILSGYVKLMSAAGSTELGTIT